MGIFTNILFAPDDNAIYVGSAEGINPYIAIWNATCKVESDNYAGAYNENDPNGGSYGIVQIGQLKLNEYNEANGTDYQLKDCFSIAISRKIFMWHYTHYGTDIETACKAWNGSGPMTEKYWRKIQEHL